MGKEKVSPIKRLLGWALVLASMVIGVSVAFWLVGPGESTTGPEITDEQGSCFLIALWVAGVGSLVVGSIAWMVTYALNGLVFEFGPPVWGSFRRRIWFSNILVVSCLVIGSGLCVTATASPLMTAAGFGATASFLVPSLGVILTLQLLSTAFNLWAPLETRVVAKSMAAKGVVRPGEAAWILGVSDATKSALRTFFSPERDVGFLSFEADEWVFRGEKEALRAARESTKIFREADAGNVAGLFGIAHVVLRYTADGEDQAIRLHPLGVLTIWRYRRRCDSMETELGGWFTP